MALIATELGTLGTIHKLCWRNGDIKNPKALYYSLQTFASNLKTIGFKLITYCFLKESAIIHAI